jgi:hypothetical protein
MVVGLNYPVGVHCSKTRGTTNAIEDNTQREAATATGNELGAATAAASAAREAAATSAGIQAGMAARLGYSES